MKKKISEKKLPQKKQNDLNNLYVKIEEPKKKKKIVLLGLKSILIEEEKQESFIEIRKEKKRILEILKKKIDSINLNFKKLEENFPIIKDVESSEKNFEHESSKYRKKENFQDIHLTTKSYENKDIDKIEKIRKNLSIIEEKLKTL